MGFIRFLADYVAKNEIDLVIPVTDVSTYLITHSRSLFEAITRLPLPSFEAFDFLSDKAALLRHCQKNSIPIPHTCFIEDGNVATEAVDRFSYPVVVKPARSRLLTDEGWITGQVHYANSAQELRQLYREKGYLRYPSLIQERVVGSGLGVFLLFDRGQLLMAFGHKRLREKPPSGGVSVLRESIPVDQALQDSAARLFGPLGWHGVAMMECKLDQKRGQALLIEVNGRFWGSLQLAIDAGVDFPYLLCQLAMGRDIEAPVAYQVGVKSRWLLGDLDHLLLRLFKKDQDLHLPPGFPSRASSLLQFLKFYSSGLHYEVLSLKDPQPFIYELSSYVQEVVRREQISHG
jgi:predicted ATP-grasp superfamily ATP-dependent carboligase